MYITSLFPVITKPTKVTSCSTLLSIDNLVTNVNANDHSCTGIFNNDMSDHFPIFYIDHSSNVKILAKYIRKRVYSPENIQRCINACDSHDKSDALTCNGAQEAFTLHHNDFTKMYDYYLPIRNIKLFYKNRKFWLREGLRKSIEYKNKLYRPKMGSISQEPTTKYNICRNKILF